MARKRLKQKLSKQELNEHVSGHSLKKSKVTKRNATKIMKEWRGRYPR